MFATYDLAVMRVTGIQDIRDCGHVLAGVAGIDSLISANSRASLIIANPRGLFERSALEIRAAAASGHAELSS